MYTVNVTSWFERQEVPVLTTDDAAEAVALAKRYIADGYIDAYVRNKRGAIVWTVE